MLNDENFPVPTTNVERFWNDFKLSEFLSRSLNDENVKFFKPFSKPLEKEQNKNNLPHNQN